MLRDNKIFANVTLPASTPLLSVNLPESAVSEMLDNVYANLYPQA